MPTKRKRKGRGLVAKITPEALAAWSAGDVWGLHHALRLRPWQDSPLAVSECVAVGPDWHAEVIELRDELQRLAPREDARAN